MPSTINATPTSSGLIQSADASGVLALQTGGTTAVTIDGSQNVGIGTTSPAAKLDFGVTSLGTNVINLRKNGNYINAIGVDSNGFTRIGCPSDAGVAFSTLSFSDGTTYTERMRIDSSGNLLVGTSASSGRLTVSTAASGYVAQLITSTNSADYIAFNNGGGIVGSIVRVGGSNVAYNTSSDYRLKENIAPMTGALAKVAQLKPCTYTWKVDGSDGQGFIAHELAEVVPDCVNGEKDAVNEDGSIKAQGIDTSFLVATLTAAIQEQQALITQLQADVAALKVRP